MTEGEMPAQQSGTPSSPLISVCIVTGDRHEGMTDCLRSLLDQIDAPPFEVLVCATSDPDMKDTVTSIFPEAKVGFALGAFPGGARNHLLSEAAGAWLYFVDDDATVDPAALQTLSRLVREWPEAGVIGGPNETPPGSSFFQALQGAVLGSLAGTGPVRKRYTSHAAAPADQSDLILCNLAVRADVMEPFDPELICAEENGLLAVLKEKGVPMRYEPSLSVYHDRRPDVGSFARQMYKYGYGRGQLILRKPATFRPLFLLPSVLVCALVAAVAVAWAVPLLWVPVALYGLWAIGGAVKVASSFNASRLRAFGLAFVLLTLVHSCYGVGVLAGLIPGWRRTPPGKFHWLEPALSTQDAAS
jgi:succinoglycan biosynthesis protein ExoA